MRDAYLQLAAFLSNVAGLSWLALAMNPHWRQVHPSRPLTPRAAIVLRTLGVLALAGSLFFCLRVDRFAIASLVWVMYLAVAALLVTFTLTSRPRWLAILASVASYRRRAEHS